MGQMSYFKKRLLEVRESVNGIGEEQCPFGHERCGCGDCMDCGLPRHHAVHGTALRNPQQHFHHAFVESVSRAPRRRASLRKTLA